MMRRYARILSLCLVLALLVSAGCEPTPQQQYDSMMAGYKDALKSQEKVSSNVPTVGGKSAWDRFMDSFKPARTPAAPTVK